MKKSKNNRKRNKKKNPHSNQSLSTIIMMMLVIKMTIKNNLMVKLSLTIKLMTTKKKKLLIMTMLKKKTLINREWVPKMHSEWKYKRMTTNWKTEYWLNERQCLAKLKLSQLYIMTTRIDSCQISVRSSIAMLGLRISMVGSELQSDRFKKPP